MVQQTSGEARHHITACYQNLREYESSMQTSVTREPLSEIGRGERRAVHGADLGMSLKLTKYGLM